MTHDWSNDNPAAHGTEGHWRAGHGHGHYVTPGGLLNCLLTVTDEAGQPLHSGYLHIRKPRYGSDPSAMQLIKAARQYLNNYDRIPEDVFATFGERYTVTLRAMNRPYLAIWRREIELGTFDESADYAEESDLITTCDSCGDHVFHEHTITTADREQIGTQEACGCDDNYFYCDDCSQYYHADQANNVDGQSLICDDCIRTGDYYETDNGYSTEPPPCDAMDGFMRQYTYHTNPNDTLGWTIPANSQLYGIELEFNGQPDDPAHLADACHKRAILTEDGTVDGEIVSVAMSAGMARTYLRALMPALAGTTNTQTVGMHVHVSRTALTAAQWYHLAQFCAKHADTLEAIGGRPSNKWHDLRKTSETRRQWLRPNADPLEYFLDTHTPGGERYAGLNFTNSATVEFRYNRATHTLSRALARFGAIQRLIALGRLDMGMMPDREQLRSWLAEDPYIRRETGWTPGIWQYPGRARDQTQHEHQGPDQIAA